MPNKRIIAAAVALAALIPASAQSIEDFFRGWPFGGFTQPSAPAMQQKQQVNFEYDVDFEYILDNREFYPSRGTFTPSSTIHLACLNPSVGVSVMQGNSVRHRIMLGIDIFKNMGETPVQPSHSLYAPDEADPALENTRLLREMTVYYQAQALTRKGLFNGYAGVFPRNCMQGDYSQALFSDSLKVCDRNLEGMLLQYSTPRFFAELGCDWVGMFGVDRRERFQIFSAGEYDFTPWLSAGWAGTMFHHACSRSAGGVTYSNLLNPYVKFDFTQWVGLQELTLKCGAMGIHQAHQENGPIEKYLVGCGGEMVTRVRHWNAGIENTLYVGPDLLPWYDNIYAANSRVNDSRKDMVYFIYGNGLYTGSPLYHTGTNSASLYDRLEAFWQPRIASFLDLRIAAVFHFSDREYKYIGSQQKVSLIFDLEPLRHPKVQFQGVTTRERSGRQRRTPKQYKAEKYAL